MHLTLLVILAAFLLAACGQSEPPAKGEAGSPGPAGRPAPLARPAPLVRPTPLLTDGQLGSSPRLAIKRPVARVANRMSKFSMPTRSIPKARLALSMNAT
jgi:hypothetical protein